MNFQNQHWWCHNCRLYNNHVKDNLGDWNHCMYDCGVWFLMVIVSCLCTLWYLSSVKKQKHDLFMFCSIYNKKLLDSVCVISRIIKVSVRVISLSLRLITPTSTLIILDITRTSSNNCLSLLLILDYTISTFCCCLIFHTLKLVISGKKEP